MIETEKHKLKKPEQEDDVILTIDHLAENFDTIDDLIEQSTSDIDFFLKEGETYPISMRVWNEIPRIKEYVGWVNVRTGTYAPKWKSGIEYKVGDLVTTDKNNGHVYRCVEEGTSGSSQPSFSTTRNSKATDLAGVREWEKEYVYEVGDIVYSKKDDEKLYHFKCISSGMSGSSEPEWTTQTGTTVMDETIQWQVYKTVTWQESGDACNFRGFGKIE